MTRRRSARGRSWLVFFGAGMLVWMAAVDAEARMLNVHGLAEVTVRGSRDDHRVSGTTWSPDTTHAVLQRYQLGTSGDLYHQNLGSYTANVSLTDDVSRTNGDRTQDLSVKDFYFSLNLLPRKTPVTFYAQRIVQDQDTIGPGTFGTVSTTSTYNMTWDIPLQRLPRLRVNLYQTELEIDSTLSTSAQRTRAAALDANGTAGSTSYFARYQHTQLRSDLAETTSYTVTGSTDTRFTPALSAATRVNYSSSVSTLGVVTPGLSTLQQRSAGASVYYRPSLHTTMSGSYDYYRDPFIRHLATGSVSLRPTQQIDVSAGYRFSRFDVPSALTLTHHAFSSATYRPLFGLSTNLNLAAGSTEVQGALATTSVYQNLGYGANYLKTLTLVSYRLGFQGSYNQNKLSTQSGLSHAFTNVFSVGASNTQTRLVSVAADYAMSITRQRAAGAESSNQRDHRVQLTANSGAPRNLFRQGDYLVLNGFVSYAVSSYRTFTNRTFLVSTTNTYETGRGLAATLGYLYEEESQQDYDNRSLSFIQLRWLSYIVRNGSLDVTARQSWERYDGYRPDETRSEAGTLFTYYIGKLSLSADYRMTLERRPSERRLLQTAYAKATRTF